MHIIPVSVPVLVLHVNIVAAFGNQSTRIGLSVLLLLLLLLNASIKFGLLQFIKSFVMQNPFFIYLR